MPTNFHLLVGGILALSLYGLGHAIDARRQAGTWRDSGIVAVFFLWAVDAALLLVRYT